MTMEPLLSVVNAKETAQPTENEICEYPWKYLGYKSFTAFSAADADFFALRRFDRLHTRSLLTLQDQLSELEGRLDALDAKFSAKDGKLVGARPPYFVFARDLPSHTTDDSRHAARDINNGTLRDDVEERKVLVSEITAKLEEYDHAVLRYSKMRQLLPAPERNIRNIEKWLEDNEGAINPEETEFVQHRDELISMSSPKSLARQWFEEQVVLRLITKLRRFNKRPQPFSGLTTRDCERMNAFSDTAVDVFESLALFLSATVMLIAPLWILNSVQSLNLRLAVITVFVVFCFGFLSLTAVGRPFEKIAATAGYSAVLVVFLQLGTQGGAISSE